MVGRVACQANPNTLLDVTTSVLFCYGDILNDVHKVSGGIAEDEVALPELLVAKWQHDG